SVERHRAGTAALVDERLRRLVAAGGGDLIQALYDVPITAVCHLLGVPAGDISRFIDYGETLRAVFTLTTRDRLPAAAPALGPVTADVEATVDQRRATPGDDLITALLGVESDGDRLTHDELIRTIGNLIAGGHDTTLSQTGCMLLTLFRHPETLAAIRDGHL